MLIMKKCMFHSHLHDSFTQSTSCFCAEMGCLFSHVLLRQQQQPHGKLLIHSAQRSRSPLSPEETEHERDKMLLRRRVAASCLGMHDNQRARVCVCILSSSETHPGAAVHKAPRDLQHVRVLFELQQVPLQLLLVAGHLAELHLQPLKLLLKGTAESDACVQASVLSQRLRIQACSHHDLQDLSGGRSQWTFVLLWNSDVGLLNLPEEVTCQHREAQANCCWLFRAPERT